MCIRDRLDTISNYDKIIVLEGGNMVGQGRHEELISNCKVYKEMLEKEKKLSAIGESANTLNKENTKVDQKNF